MTELHFSATGRGPLSAKRACACRTPGRRLPHNQVSGFTEIVRATLAAGADLKSVNRYGGTALIPACHHGHVDTVRLLLGTAIEVDHVNNLGWTALLEAVILGDGGPAHAEIVRMLVARGANVNLADRQGVSPLAHAVQRGQKQVVQLLRAAGAR